MQIVEAQDHHLDHVLQVERQAFPSDEAVPRLVADLLLDATARPSLSLLAYEGALPVGHVLFTHARLTGASQEITARILAPLAVIPECQRRGSGVSLSSEAWSAWPRRASGSCSCWAIRITIRAAASNPPFRTGSWRRTPSSRKRPGWCARSMPVSSVRSVAGWPARRPWIGRNTGASRPMGAVVARCVSSIRCRQPRTHGIPGGIEGG